MRRNIKRLHHKRNSQAASNDLVHYYSPSPMMVRRARRNNKKEKNLILIYFFFLRSLFISHHNTFKFNIAFGNLHTFYLKRRKNVKNIYFALVSGVFLSAGPIDQNKRDVVNRLAGIFFNLLLNIFIYQPKHRII